MSTPEPVDIGLAWGISGSFLDYLERIGDATIDIGDGAAMTSTGEFFFPFVAATPERTAFGGELSMRAHFGALEVRLAAPAVEWGRQPVLTVAGASAGTRLRLVALHPAEVIDEGSVRMWPGVATTLHPDACHLFGGVYPPGEPFAPLTVRTPTRTG